MSEFATAAQMEARTEGAISTGHPYLESALNAAESLIREFCGWHIAPVMTSILKLDGPGGELLDLPTLRLVDLTSVTDAGTALDVEDLEVSDTGLIAGHCWGSKLGSVAVVMDHGFEEIPATLTDLTLQIAARSLSSPTGAIREQTLSSSVTWTQAAFNVAGGTVLLEHEKLLLARYRIGWAP